MYVFLDLYEYYTCDIKYIILYPYINFIIN